MIHSRLGRRQFLTTVLALAWAISGIQALSAVAEQTPAPARFIAILIDDLHIEFKLTTSVRKMLRVISDALLRESDLFTIRSTGYSQIHQKATSERPRFAEAILKVQGGGLSDRDVASGDSAVANSARGRAETTASVIRELLGDLRSMPDRRKVLLCISPNPCTPSANGADVVIGTLDPRKFATARDKFDELIAKINAEIR